MSDGINLSSISKHLRNSLKRTLSYTHTHTPQRWDGRAAKCTCANAVDPDASRMKLIWQPFLTSLGSIREFLPSARFNNLAERERERLAAGSLHVNGVPIEWTRSVERRNVASVFPPCDRFDFAQVHSRCTGTVARVRFKLKNGAIYSSMFIRLNHHRPPRLARCAKSILRASANKYLPRDLRVSLKFALSRSQKKKKSSRKRGK